jgi:hypothetical protein
MKEFFMFTCFGQLLSWAHGRTWCLTTWRIYNPKSYINVGMIDGFRRMTKEEVK